MQLPQQFQSHRGTGSDSVGTSRRVRRTAETAGLNVANSSMHIEAGSLPGFNPIGSHSQPPSQGTVGRHGSAARFSSRERGGSRSGSRLAGNPTAQATAYLSAPAGPQEGAEWRDVLDDVIARITILERTARDNGQHLAAVDVHAKKLDVRTDYLYHHGTEVEDMLVKKLDRTFAEVNASVNRNSDLFIALEAKSADVEVALTQMKDLMSRLMSTQPERFNMTPPQPQAQATSHEQEPEEDGLRANDPWAADRARQYPYQAPQPCQPTRPSEVAQNQREPNPWTGFVSTRQAEMAQQAGSSQQAGMAYAARAPLNGLSMPVLAPQQTVPVSGWPPMPASFAQSFVAPNVGQPVPNYGATMPTHGPGMQAGVAGVVGCPFTPSPGPRQQGVQGHHDDVDRKFGICRKKNESLKIFKAEATHYKEWRDRVVDHCCRTNRKWRQALDYIAQDDQPWTFARLSGMDLDGYNLVELAKIFFDWIVDWLPQRLYNRRLQLCGREFGNGFEMWRRFRQKYEGTGAVMEVAGVDCLHAFPRCKGMMELEEHLEAFEEMLDKYGSQLIEFAPAPQSDGSQYAAQGVGDGAIGPSGGRHMGGDHRLVQEEAGIQEPEASCQLLEARVDEGERAEVGGR